MEVKIEKLSRGELANKGVFSWPVWEKEKSEFDWSYDSIEECYFLEGEVILHTEDGREFRFGKGDFVTFPLGLNCRWEIKAAVSKHYNFR